MSVKIKISMNPCEERVPPNGEEEDGREIGMTAGHCRIDQRAGQITHRVKS